MLDQQQPLIFNSCLGVASKDTADSGAIFGGVFVIVWLGSAVVTVNGQLLGGSMYVLFM
jgi:hypothetical protein